MLLKIWAKAFEITPAKECIYQQICWLEAHNFTKNEPPTSDFQKILPALRQPAIVFLISRTPPF